MNEMSGRKQKRSCSGGEEKLFKNKQITCNYTSKEENIEVFIPLFVTSPSQFVHGIYSYSALHLNHVSTIGEGDFIASIVNLQANVCRNMGQNEYSTEN